MLTAVLWILILDPGVGAFLLPGPGSGSGIIFFRISDPGSAPFFGEIFSHFLQNPFMLS
jgi:hypothetical protein